MCTEQCTTSVQTCMWAAVWDKTGPSVWERLRCLFEVVQLPIYFSLSAFCSSNSPSSAEPSPAPLVRRLSLLLLTNLSLIYLFLCFCRWSLRLESPAVWLWAGTDNKQEVGLHTEKETRGIVSHHEGCDGADFTLCCFMMGCLKIACVLIAPQWKAGCIWLCAHLSDWYLQYLS